MYLRLTRMSMQACASILPPLPPLPPPQWVANNTWCHGQVLFNVTNIGDSTVAPWVYGPIGVTAAPGSPVLLSEPGSYLHYTNNGEGGEYEGLLEGKMKGWWGR